MQINRLLSVCAVVALFAVAGFAADVHATGMFQGPKANTGAATHVTENGKSLLRVTSDFEVPDTPAPTWRVVDSKGNIYTLDAFKIQGGEKRQIEVPAYVPNIVKVQVYCAWAQVLLGEARFASPVK